MTRRLLAIIGALALLSGAALLVAQSRGVRLFVPVVVSSLTPLASPIPSPVTPSPGPSATPRPAPATPAVPSPTPQLTPVPSPEAPLPVPPADEVSARLQTPPGFAVRRFATGLQAPRLMSIGPDGQLYVAERGAGRIVRLPDRNNDGLADGVEVFAADLSGVHSLEWDGADLYAAMNDRVVRLRDTDQDGSADERTTVVAGLPNDGGHSTRTARIGPDRRLYVAVGSRCNIPVGGCSEGDPRRAAILRYNLDGSLPPDNPFIADPDPRRRAVWAEGLRNSVDFVFTADGRLWATHNGSDGMGDDLPPEEIVIEVEAGKHYGWPYCYTAQIGAVPEDAKEVRDERVPLDERVPSCDVVTPARFTDLAHSAPLGVVQYRATHFPAMYRGNLFVAYHGSWDSSTPRDCRVQQIIVEGGRPVRAEGFLTGFRDSPSQQCGGAWGRPAGVTVGPRGELFVSDDHNGRIYRVVYVSDR